MTTTPEPTDGREVVIVQDEALAAFAALGGPGARGSVADMLRNIITAGRDTRVLLEPPEWMRRRRMWQYPTFEALTAALDEDRRLVAARALLDRWQPVRAQVTIPGHFIAEFYDGLAEAVGVPGQLDQGGTR